MAGCWVLSCCVVSLLPVGIPSPCLSRQAEEDVDEYVLLTVPTVFVKKVPPRTSAVGYKYVRHRSLAS